MSTVHAGDTARQIVELGNPLRVPGSLGGDTLLGLLRQQGLQVAIVSDEHGGTVGIITLEAPRRVGHRSSLGPTSGSQTARTAL
ncbi:hypothetical protein [Arthrobacter sp. Br18]|uniref:hypothetical protein n=1 Tax=Arthrobacter sp. Br18 TaxID=1312954 RepID=UPI0020A679A7|nr:hypothetical protein [Arthrobacter sp. Br18]